MKKKILFVDDEPFLSRIVKETLELKGYDVLYKKDGTRILDAVASFEPDICLLDVMLPHIDGYTLGSTIRNIYPTLPVIFLTAKTQTDDVVKGFSSGGTDYVKKPFSMEELMVRIENQIRLVAKGDETTKALADKVMLGNAVFIPSRFELHIANEVIKLSHREAQILTVLCNNPNTVVDRKKLLTQIWGDDSFFNSRNLDVYIRKLREYFATEPAVSIVTLKGIGYHFSVPQ